MGEVAEDNFPTRTEWAERGGVLPRAGVMWAAFLCLEKASARAGRKPRRRDLVARSTSQGGWPRLLILQTATTKSGCPALALFARAGTMLPIPIPFCFCDLLPQSPGAAFLATIPYASQNTRDRRIVSYDVAVHTRPRAEPELLPCGQQGGNSWSYFENQTRSSTGMTSLCEVLATVGQRTKRSPLEHCK